MSGNPFRASLVPKPPTAAPPTSFINADSSREAEAYDERGSDSVLDASSTIPARTKKSVRIESPTETSPPHASFHKADDPLLRHLNVSRHAGSPPPVSPAGFSDNFEDIDTDDLEKRDDEIDSHGMTGSTRKSMGRPEAVHSPTGAPANPFSRTLASMEPQEKGKEDSAAQNRDRTATERTAKGTTKASLDVEGFKNLLMTGISSPRSSGPPPPQSAPASNAISGSVFESSSSTDTSSISRHSIFEPVQEAHPESPRTSYDMAASDDDRASLMGEIKKEKKKPPPAPKHRHGKLVSSRTPQTVSFSDFSATAPTTSPPTTRDRTNSDLNKPLPPTPAVVSPPIHIVSQDSTQDTSSIADVKTSETSSLSDAASAPKKVPPPVPLARRQSQLRTSNAGNRSRSNSSLTMSSQHSGEIPILSPGATQDVTSSPSQKAPPPPPPTRRHGATLSTINTSSANSSSTELSSAATTRRATVSSPNPPSSRRTTISSDPPSPSPGVARTSSISSNRPNSRSVSNESANMPPPPPPPRRRQSGRSSLDKERPTIPTSPTETRRTSTEYKRSSVDGKRRTSVASESSLKYEYAPAASAENESALYSPKEETEEPTTYNLEVVNADTTKILNDMEQFQKEIDELREKYKQAA